MMSQRGTSSLRAFPPEPGQIFLGRTGRGSDVEVREVDDWLDVRYVDAEGEVRGFSLNVHYAGLLTQALVQVLAKRAGGGRRATVDGGQ